MKLQELYIFNETYHLPKEEYLKFKGKVDACSDNPMCLNDVKSEAESFISAFGKKVGTKIENGEQSKFSMDGRFADSITTKTTDGPKLNPIKILVLVGIIFFVVMAIRNKSVYMGFGAIFLGAIFAMRNDQLDRFFSSR